MILESVILDVKLGQGKDFESAFAEAQTIVASMPGYCSHELLECIEKRSRYLLQIRWTTLEAHTDGFRKSEQYTRWKQLLHHFYAVAPNVEHYRGILPRT